MCIGTESRLSDCSWDIHVVSTSTAVGMRCDPCEHIVLLIILLLTLKSAILDACFDGAIRLADGESEREGRVEICSSRRWGTVCDNQWTIKHTAVVCRFLGYSDLLDGGFKLCYEGF